MSTKGKTLIVLAGIFTFFYFFQFFKYQINPDAVSYISIARKYAAGNWGEAINSYWSPLFSWLIAAFIKYNVDPLSAAKIISAVAGLGLILLLAKILTSLRVRPMLIYPSLLASIPLLVYICFTFTTPDPLTSLFVIYYFYLSWKDNYFQDNSAALKIGVISGLAFLSKAYSLPFLLAHFSIFNFLYYINSTPHRKLILSNYFTALAIFLTISASWIIALSLVSHHFVISSVGTFDHANWLTNSASFPMHNMGLFPPTDKFAISAWDDPSKLRVSDWSIFGSLAHIRLQAAIISRNLLTTAVIFDNVSHFSLPIFLGSLFLGLYYLVKRKITFWLYTTTTILIYISGYVTIWIEDRLVWPVYLWLFILAVYLFRSLLGSRHAKVKVFILYFLFLITLASFAPLKSVIRSRNVDKDIYDLAQYLKSPVHISGLLASKCNWHKSLALTYYLNLKYLGEAQSQSSDQLAAELSGSGANYFLDWSDCSVSPSGWQKVVVLPAQGVQVLKSSK